MINSVRARPLENACRNRPCQRRDPSSRQLFSFTDAVILGGLLDVGEGKLAVGVRNALDLIEAGERVYHMTGVGQRLFPLQRKANTLSGSSARL